MTTTPTEPTPATKPTSTEPYVAGLTITEALDRGQGLTKEQTVEILERVESGVQVRQIARDYNCPQRTIRTIVKRASR